MGPSPIFVSFVRRVFLRMTAVGWAFCCRCFCISEGVSPYHHGYGALLFVIVLIHDACLGGSGEQHFLLLSNRRDDEGDAVYTKQRLPCVAYTSFEHMHTCCYSF